MIALAESGMSTLATLRNSEAKWKTNGHTIPFISYDVFQNGKFRGSMAR